MRTQIVVVAALALASQASGAVLVLNPIDRGNYANDGGHVPVNNSYLTGNESQGPSILRSFFVFDLTSISEPIVSAELQLVFNFYASADPTETMTFYDVGTPWDELFDGSAEVDAFNDLGTGTVYSERVWSEADKGSYLSVFLNTAAVNDMNAATDLWGIGGALTSLDGNLTTSEFLNPGTANANDLASTILVIETIPAPPAFAALAFGSLAFRKRRRDR